jgi:hypothetical protein
MKIEIKSCQECSELQISRVYTADSFDNICKWTCKMVEKEIHGFLEWRDKDPEIPNWCPKKV